MSEPENTRFRDSNVSAWLCNAHIFWKYMQRGANLHALTTIPLQVYCLPRMYGPFLYAVQGCARVARTERHPKMERAHWCQMRSRQRHAVMITYEFLTPVGWAFMYKHLRGITGHLYIKMAAWPDVQPQSFLVNWCTSINTSISESMLMHPTIGISNSVDVFFAFGRGRVCH